MAGLYDFYTTDYRQSPYKVDRTPPVTQLASGLITTPIADRAKSNNQDEFRKERERQAAVQQKAIDDQASLRSLREMELNAGGHPFTPRTPTMAQGYSDAEELQLATNIREPSNYFGLNETKKFEVMPQQTEAVASANATSSTKNSKSTKKKGLTQDQMKSRIEASAYANADPNKWGLNGKMPQGWGVVKKSNGEVVVTPPSESNFWGDPEAEKAWRAAEADRKMGLWSMEKTMDPNAPLKERQLAADIYDMRLRQQAAAVQKGLDPRAQALAEQRMHEGYVNQGRNRLEAMFNNLAQMEPDEAKRAQLLYNMNSTLGRDRRLWMKNGQPIMNLTDLDERVPLIADYMRALYENWKATGVWETDLSRIKGDHTWKDRLYQLFADVPQTPHGQTLDGRYTQIPMVENRRVNNLIHNTQEYNDKRGLRE